MKVFRIRTRHFPAAPLAALAVVCWAAALWPAADPVHAAPSPAAQIHSPRSGVAASRSTTVVLLHQRLVRVSIHNFAFAPARLVVSPNTRVVWTNGDGDPHTVTADRSGWASEALDTGNQFARVFKTAGTFPYHCAIHPFMHGTVIVKR